MKPSRNVYLLGFAALGFFVSFLVHAGTEITVIYFLEKDFARYSFGMSWKQLLFLHHIVALLLTAAGLYYGYRQGQHWWKRIYERKI